MTRLWTTLAILATAAIMLGQGHQQAEPSDPDDQPADPAVRFIAVDVLIDSGTNPLAAYQFEFNAAFPENHPGTVKIVGIEGGSHNAYAQPPYYDPAALAHDRVIIAAFNTSALDNLPTASTRIARLHLQVVGSPRFIVKLIVATDPAGNDIHATITAAPGESP